jgi:hypothetical protein
MYGPVYDADSKDLTPEPEMVEVAEEETHDKFDSTPFEEREYDAQPFYTLVEKPDVHEREAMYFHIGRVAAMLQDPQFYHADSIGGVSEDVRKYKAMLIRKVTELDPEQQGRMLSLDEFLAVTLTESHSLKTSSPFVNFNCAGDKGLKNKAWGVCQLRKDAWGEITKDNGSRKLWTDAELEYIDSLSISDKNFHGDLLLSYLTLQLWHVKYSDGGESFHKRAGSYNAGPGRGNSTYSKKAIAFQEKVKELLPTTADYQFADVMSLAEAFGVALN